MMNTKRQLQNNFYVSDIYIYIKRKKKKTRKYYKKKKKTKTNEILRKLTH